MVKVAVLGASGQIGQPLSLLLKSSPLVSDLRLYDVVHAVGVATDLNHIDTPAPVKGYLPGNDGLQKALSGAEVVLISADLFKTNASIIADLATGVAKFCPTAFVGIITNPVNSTVPIAAEVLKKNGVFNPQRLFGVTTLDVVRGSKFVADVLGNDPRQLKVPVVGGHSGATILPLISQSEPKVQLSQEQIEAITHRVQFGGDEIVKAKAGAGSATTCMAYAGFRFAQAIIKAAQGQTGIVEPAYVYLPGVPGGDAVSRELGVEYFAVPVSFGANGAETAHPIGSLSDYETKLLKIAVDELKGNVKKGEDFARA
ncbi:malate dehydrogenase [Colletotrichum sp. SAR 10_70]|nr:malate dehydrogenase [Colletotrichum sp. SAR 10_71]KAI8187314.1 malate dehydrogenase [Colletotrichum sp. SAR 10_75]KAI8204795.1 malate dehydrogenase [Colletotrichum sp. SAR 10_70]KAI8211964.1 malate dehydrogenase [Colletotrichum sp. SAR 10_76]KAJ5003708.1 malate dehydrogenase [Colletotrichum sp. SAR 10_66]